MVFRLAVIPAGAAASAEEAGRIVTAMRAAPRGRTPTAVTEVLGALESSGFGHFTVGHRADARGALLSVPVPEGGTLEALLLLAYGREIAVYDIKLNRLYDPAGAADVDVSVPGLRIPFLTRDLLSDLVLRPGWPDPEAPYVIVDRADQDFIQVWCDTGSYRLEYREGSAEFHYMCAIDDPAAVVEVMWDWVIGGRGWRGALPWEFLDLDATRSVRLQDLDATVDADGTLKIGGDDCWYTILADDVPRLVAALGGDSRGDVLELLVKNHCNVGVDELGAFLDEAGVSYRLACWS